MLAFVLSLALRGDLEIALVSKLFFVCFTIRSFLLFIILTNFPPPPFAADISLSQKLKEELTYEKESLPEPKPEFVKTFVKEGVWEVCITSFVFCCCVA